MQRCTDGEQKEKTDGLLEERQRCTDGEQKEKVYGLIRFYSFDSETAERHSPDV